VAHDVLFLIRGFFLTAAIDDVRSFSMRPEVNPFPTLVVESFLPLDETTAFRIPVSNGSDEG
jgi:hypothetical protein